MLHFKMLAHKRALVVRVFLFSALVLAWTAEALDQTTDYAGGLCVAGPGGCLQPDQLACREALAEEQLAMAKNSPYGNVRPALASGAGDRKLEPGRDHYQVFSLEPRPRWLTSVAWDSSNNQLIAVNAADDSLYFYSFKQGNRAVRIKEVKMQLGSEEGFSPRSVQASSDGFVAQSRKSDFRWMSTDFNHIATSRIDDFAKKGSGTAKYVWSWAPAGKWLVGFATISANGDWHHGIVRVSREHKDSFSILTTFPWKESMNQYYTLGNSYVTSSSNLAYVLIMDQAPYIEEVGVDKRRLAAFPERFESIPAFAVRNNSGNITEVYEFLARSTVPVGLFSCQCRDLI